MSLTPAETDRLLRDLMDKNKSMTSERDSAADKVAKLNKRIKELENEAADALASAEAANMGKSAVERDWTERLVKVHSVDHSAVIDDLSSSQIVALPGASAVCNKSHPYVLGALDCPSCCADRTGMGYEAQTIRRRAQEDGC
jgi:hypothetical protein